MVNSFCDPSRTTTTGDENMRTDKVLDYQLGELLGKGGMGMVYKGYAPDKSPVAVKFLHPQYNAQTEYVTRFEREAKLAQRLAHPNVVKVLDTGKDDLDRHFIIMEFVSGNTVRV